MTEPIVIQFNCPKCRDADWGRGTEWVTVDRDLLAKTAADAAWAPENWRLLDDDNWLQLKAQLRWFE